MCCTFQGIAAIQFITHRKILFRQCTSHHSTANRMALHTPAHTYTHCSAFNCTAYCTALHSRALHGNASFCILHGIAFQCIDCMFIRTLSYIVLYFNVYIQYTYVNSLTLHNTTEHELEPWKQVGRQAGKQAYIHTIQIYKLYMSILKHLSVYLYHKYVGNFCWGTVVYSDCAQFKN